VVDEFRIVFCLCCGVYGHPENWKTILSLSTIYVLTFGKTREVDEETYNHKRYNTNNTMAVP
jgi:hypothetical protein